MVDIAQENLEADVVDDGIDQSKIQLDFKRNVTTRNTHEMLKNADLKRILIVDDDIFNIQAVKILLQCVFKIPNLDQICTEAYNGQ